MKAKLTPLASAFGLAAILAVSAFGQEKAADLPEAGNAKRP